MNYHNPPDYLADEARERFFDAQQVRIEEQRMEEKIAEAQAFEMFLKLPLQEKLQIVRLQILAAQMNVVKLLTLKY